MIPLLAAVALLSACQPKVEQADVFINNSDETITIETRQFNTAQAIPDKVIASGESAVLRQYQ